MNFWIILFVGLLEGLIAYPLIHGQGWGKKGDILTAMAGALIVTVIYRVLNFPMHDDSGVIFTSIVGATLFLFPVHFASKSVEVRRVKS